MTARPVDAAFARARAEGRAALVVYGTAGDPDLDRSLEVFLAAAEAGADLLEVGVPFSDPNADGPAIQAAMARALAAGATPPKILSLVETLRARTQVPVVLFSYANPLLALGEDAMGRIAAAGADGVLVLDVPHEHAGFLRVPAEKAGLSYVGLSGPRTPVPRARAIAASASGFLYQVARTGVTGARRGLDPQVADRLAALRASLALPVAVGFGVRSPEDVAGLASLADGVVVGSRLVTVAAEAFEAGRNAPAEVAREVAVLRRATHRRLGEGA